jgi:C-terminal peptidase prc
MLAVQDRQLRGSFSGIGTQLRLKDGKLVIVTPLEGSPALAAGLRPGTRVLAIDGKSVEGLSLTEVVQRVVGAEGSALRLKVLHPGGKEEELAITRRRVNVPTVQGFRRGPGGRWDYLLEGEQKVGYLQITNFGQTATKEVQAAVRSLQAQGLRGLVLDLRFCPGGLISQAVDVTKLFLAKGTVVSLKGRGPGENVWKADRRRVLGDFPLVVLVNEQTASAGEVVAGALGENGRAVVVGTRTYGKASVQEFVKLPDGGALKLTTAHYLLPGGRNIHRGPGAKSWGVDPTDGYYVPLDGARAEALLERMHRRAFVGGREEAPRPEKVTPGVLDRRRRVREGGPADRGPGGRPGPPRGRREAARGTAEKPGAGEQGAGRPRTGEGGRPAVEEALDPAGGDNHEHHLIVPSPEPVRRFAAPPRARGRRTGFFFRQITWCDSVSAGFAGQAVQPDDAARSSGWTA